MAGAYEEVFVTAPDGLRLACRLYGEPRPARLPLLCLAGLSRNSADFEVLAEDLSRERQVITTDYRGRGRSDHDPNWKNYAYPVELADINAVVTALGVHRAVVLGTSRGGVHAMLLGAVRPGLLGGVILNDIGPKVDGRGLARIKSYLGKMPTPPDFVSAATLLKSLAGAQFPAASEADWARQAAAIWREEGGRLTPTFDLNLTRTLEGMDFETAVPELWPQFDGLAKTPTLVVRGEHSDILSAETVQAMAARRPDLETFTVPGQGHAPFLTDQPTIGRIAAFARICDGRGH